MLKGILNFSHHLLEESIEKGETVIDATCGNGNDTLFLSKLVGETEQVLAFNIHEKATDYVSQEMKGKMGCNIFNLGNLPKSDKTIITQGHSTITAIDTMLQLLKKDGLVVIVVYHGHEGGKEEKETILKHISNLDQKHYQVLRYGFINQKNNPPFILAIQNK